MTRYFYPSLTAAVMMITAASPQSIELTHIHLKYRSMCFPFVTIMKNHLKLGWWPSPSPDGGIGRDNPTSLRLHVESFLHRASSSSDHFTPADQVWASFGQAVITYPDQLTRTRTVWCTSYLSPIYRPTQTNIPWHFCISTSGWDKHCAEPSLHFEPLSQSCLLLSTFYSRFLTPSHDLSQKVSTGTVMYSQYKGVCSQVLAASSQPASSSSHSCCETQSGVRWLTDTSALHLHITRPPHPWQTAGESLVGH